MKKIQQDLESNLNDWHLCLQKLRTNYIMILPTTRKDDLNYILYINNALDYSAQSILKGKRDLYRRTMLGQQNVSSDVSASTTTSTGDTKRKTQAPSASTPANHLEIAFKSTTTLIPRQQSREYVAIILIYVFLFSVRGQCQCMIDQLRRL